MIDDSSRDVQSEASPPALPISCIGSSRPDRAGSMVAGRPVPSTEEGQTDTKPSLPAPTPSTSSAAQSVLQTVTLLSTMAAMLLLARFTVPGIVEEVRYAWHRGELRAEYETGAEGLRNVSLESLSRAYEMVTSAVGPSVVHIDVQRRTSEQERKMGRLLGGPSFPKPAPGPAISDQGSGVIVDAEGYVLTNRHVISDGEDIHVTLSDGRRVPAAVVGSDTLTDLAVLKIQAKGLLPIQWGDSQKIRVGSPVWAVGSPFGLDRTITFGILSGKHRMVRAGAQHGASPRYQDFMQSDVAVNPGNSGGPLVDARGQLVGINTAIVGDTYQGVSFSIPSNVTKQVYQRIRETGRVARGWLGVVLAEVPDEMHRGENSRVRGALVQALASPDSPASQAGLLAGDIVHAVGDTVVSDVGHLMRLIGDAPAGSELNLMVDRQGEARALVVILGERPETVDR